MREFIDYSVQIRTNFEADMNFGTFICNPQNDKNRYKFRYVLLQITHSRRPQIVLRSKCSMVGKIFHVLTCLCRLILSYHFHFSVT